MKMGEAGGVRGLMGLPWGSLVVGLVAESGRAGLVWRVWRSRFPPGLSVLLSGILLSFLSVWLLDTWEGQTDLRRGLEAETWLKQSQCLLGGLSMVVLLMDAAFRTNVHHFRRLFRSSLFMTVASLGLAVMVHGLAWHATVLLLADDWAWEPSLSAAVGLCLSVADPRDLWGFLEGERLPQSLACQLESEHLMGVAISAAVFLPAFQLPSQGHSQVWHFLRVPLWTAAFSLAGYLLARFLIWLGPVALRDARKEMILLIAGVFFVYCLCEKVGGSGAVPVVAMGLTLRERRGQMQTKTFQQLSESLRLYAFCAQVTVYAHTCLRLGLSDPPTTSGRVVGSSLWLWGLLGWLWTALWGVVVVRLGLLGSLALVYYGFLKRREKTPSPAALLALVWGGGLKGPVGLILGMYVDEYLQGGNALSSARLLLLVLAAQTLGAFAAHALSLPVLFRRLSTPASSGSSEKVHPSSCLLPEVQQRFFRHMGPSQTYPMSLRGCIWRLVSCKFYDGDKGTISLRPPSVFPFKYGDMELDHTVSMMQSRESQESKQKLNDYLARFKGHLFHLWETSEVSPATYRRLSQILDSCSDAGQPITVDSLSRSTYGRWRLYWLGRAKRAVVELRHKLVDDGRGRVPQATSSVGSALLPLLLLSICAYAELRDEQFLHLLSLVLVGFVGLAFVIWNSLYLLVWVLGRLCHGRRSSPTTSTSTQLGLPGQAAHRTGPLHPIKKWDLVTDAVVTGLTGLLSVLIWLRLLLSACKENRSGKAAPFCWTVDWLVLAELSVWLALKTPCGMLGLLDLLRAELGSMERREEELGIQVDMAALRVCRDLEQQGAFGLSSAVDDSSLLHRRPPDSEDELKKSMALLQLNLRTHKAATEALLRSLTPPKPDGSPALPPSKDGPAEVEPLAASALDDWFTSSLQTLVRTESLTGGRRLLSRLGREVDVLSQTSHVLITQEDQGHLHSLVSREILATGSGWAAFRQDVLPPLEAQLRRTELLMRQRHVGAPHLVRTIAEQAGPVRLRDLQPGLSQPSQTVTEDQVSEQDDGQGVIAAGQSLLRQDEPFPGGRPALLFVRFGFVEVSRSSRHAAVRDWEAVVGPCSLLGLEAVAATATQSAYSVRTLTPAVLVRVDAEHLRNWARLFLGWHHLARLAQFLRSYDPFYFYTVDGLMETLGVSAEGERLSDRRSSPWRLLVLEGVLLSSAGQPAVFPRLGEVGDLELMEVTRAELAAPNPGPLQPAQPPPHIFRAQLPPTRVLQFHRSSRHPQLSHPPQHPSDQPHPLL